MILVGQSGTGTGYSSSTLVFLCYNFLSNALHPSSSYYCTYQDTRPEPVNVHTQQSYFIYRGALKIKVLYNLFWEWFMC